MNVRELEIAADRLRLDVLEEIAAAQSGHIGGALSICELLAVLYDKHMNIRPGEPAWPDRDRLVLSKGHASSALYAALAARGYFSRGELQKFRAVDGILQGHPSMTKTPGVDMSSGSLGQGLSCANGMALAGRIDHKSYQVYCICGDGEMQEGQIWEALMTAAHYKLDHLTLFIDRNGLQIDGPTTQVMNIEPLKEKLIAFGWDTQVIAGHDVSAIDQAITRAKALRGKPSAIILNTVKGKGVSFMENVAGWHGTPPDSNQAAQAREELEARLKKEEQA